jgi:hypothetical protein
VDIVVFFVYLFGFSFILFLVFTHTHTHTHTHTLQSDSCALSTGQTFPMSLMSVLTSSAILKGGEETYWSSDLKHEVL